MSSFFFSEGFINIVLERSTAIKSYCLNGFNCFFFSVRILGASDSHSGVKRIKYRFKAHSTGKIISDREYEYLNPIRVSEKELGTLKKT